MTLGAFLRAEGKSRLLFWVWFYLAFGLACLFAASWGWTLGWFFGPWNLWMSGWQYGKGFQP